MIYDIVHITTYVYAAPVGFSRGTLRLTPLDDSGQRVIAASLVTDPPGILRPRTNFFGAREHDATIDSPHGRLRVEARARVAVTRRPWEGAGPPFESIRDMAAAARSLAADSPVHHLFESPCISLDPAVTAYAAQSFPPGRGICAGALDLATRIRRDFVYDPRATLVSTPAREAFAARRGVCQDFAHVMIAGLRGMSLPAAYVGGYIHTRPPPGGQRLVGADATHAWVALWCGPALGWIGFDPTNALVVGCEHVALGFGRDYADVSPIDGIVLGQGYGQGLSVSVDMRPAGDGDDGTREGSGEPSAPERDGAPGAMPGSGQDLRQAADQAGDAVAFTLANRGGPE